MGSSLINTCDRTNQAVTNIIQAQAYKRARPIKLTNTSTSNTPNVCEKLKRGQNTRTSPQVRENPRETNLNKINIPHHQVCELKWTLQRYV